MKRFAILACAVSALALSACGQESEEAYYESADAVLARPEMPDMEEAEAGTSGEIPVSIPQIAYVYDYGFRIGAGEMSALQERHVALCESMGAEQCRVIEMRTSGGEDDYAYGTLNLAVAADKAREFGGQLAETTESGGGEQISSAISGEDLSKQIVDTEARLRARTLLRDRLMEILRNRNGSVAELVEAERGVAQVNEEIDQAQSWLAEMRGRVAFSRVNVSYESGTRSGGGFVEPIRRAFSSIGSILGNTIAALIVALTVAVPVGLVLWGLWLALRRLRKRKAGKGAGTEQD